MESTNNSYKSNSTNGKFKRKRRSKASNFLSNAKGFGRKGIYGRGTKIEENDFMYFINISDSMRGGFESVEDKVTMANNVFEQTFGQEIHLSSNQVVSKVIENLIGFTDAAHFERFQTAFMENLRPICSDQYASHVIQKIIEICFLRSVYYKHSVDQTSDDDEEPATKKKKIDLMSEECYNTTTKFRKAHRKCCAEIVLKISKFILNNLEDFVWDMYASHITRTCLLCLAGIYEKKIGFQRNNQVYQHNKPIPVPDEWTDVIKEYMNRLKMWPQFSEFPYNPLSAQLLGHLAVALKAVDKSMLKRVGKQILMESFLKNENDDDKKKVIEIVDDNGKDSTENDAPKTKVMLPMVFNHGPSIGLLETLLTVSGAKLFTQLNAMLFTGRIKVLALNRSTNFAVQKLIENTKEKVEFESIFDELQSYFEDLLQVGHTGVVCALAKSCLKHSTKQGMFVSALLATLHIAGSKEKFSSLINCILKLKPYEIAAEDKSQFIHLHGSLILQYMLEFNKPIKLVQSLLEMSAEELSVIFCNANGSRVADAFIRSKTIGEKSREKLLKHLEGNYINLAITKFGSRVLENLFEVANDVQKAKIAKELADRVNQLNGTLFGRVLFQKLRIGTYQLSATQWKAAFDKAKKAEELFKDIVS